MLENQLNQCFIVIFSFFIVMRSGNPGCKWFLSTAGIPTEDRMDKLLRSRVLENEKQCPENGSFLDTVFFVLFFFKRAEIRVHKPVTISMSN